MTKTKEPRLRTYYFVEDDCGGQHGMYIKEIQLTLKQYREVNKTHLYNGRRGFITKNYLAAMYYTED